MASHCAFSHCVSCLSKISIDEESLSLLLQVHYDEFIPMFEKQYPQFPWKEVEVSVNIHPLRLQDVFQELLEELKNSI